jgi:hypothetical protein
MKYQLRYMIIRTICTAAMIPNMTINAYPAPIEGLYGNRSKSASPRGARSGRDMLSWRGVQREGVAKWKTGAGVWIKDGARKDYNLLLGY